MERASSLHEYVDELAHLLHETAERHGNKLPPWNRVLITEDRGATESPGRDWTRLEESAPRFDGALERSTRDWLNLSVLFVKDETLYVVIEYLSDERATRGRPQTSPPIPTTSS